MKRLVYLLFILTISVVSCTETPVSKKIKFSGETQGSYYVVTYYDDEGRNFQKEIDSLLGVFDQSMSLWVDNSILNKVNDNDTTVQLDDIFIEVFKASKEISEATNGAFDFTVAPLTAAWGFGAKRRLNMDSTRVDSLLQYVGYQKVKIEKGKVIKDNPDVMFDFNAIAQGYTCDYLGDWFRSKGINDYVIDVGGEVVANGAKPDGSPWIVGIQDPTDPNEFSSYIKIKLYDKGLVTSGNYRKFHEQNGFKVVHTISPITGYPVYDSLLSATILAKDAMTADGYATACMVMGLDKSKEFVEDRDDLEGYFIYYTSDSTLHTYYTQGMKAVFDK
ncbi:MAG: FAD:protein FMN transferase [Hyphomicrobiales bacterium]